jgi:TfoX/Sxy family transcriptional regulator of competence genes
MTEMKWMKSPASLVERFGQVVPKDPSVERRSMFGYPCAFLNGHMFCGLYQDHFILRLPEAERTTFLKQAGAKVFEPMPGRPMKEYVLVPPAVLINDATLQRWLRDSVDYVAGLPPKEKKPKKGAAKKTTTKRSSVKREARRGG